MLNRKKRRNNARMMRLALRAAVHKGHDFSWMPKPKEIQEEPVSDSAMRKLCHYMSKNFRLRGRKRVATTRFVVEVGHPE
jgi:hypothetical protein